MNRFYVHPAGDITQGLQGLTSVIQGVGEKKRIEGIKQGAMEAYQSNDPDKMAEYALQNPEIAEMLMNLGKFRSERTKQNFLDSAYSVIADPSEENINRVITARQAFLRSQSQTDEDMPFTSGFMQKYRENPEQAINELKMDVAGLDPERWKSFKEAVIPTEQPVKDRYKVVGGRLVDISGDTPQIVIESTEKGKTTDKIIEFEYGEKNPEFLLQQRKEADDKKTEELEKQKFTNTMKLRKEFLSQSKDYQKVRDAYTRVINSTKDPSPAGDLSLIFNYMKMLDPGSVVRESEFATAASAGSYGERLKAAANRIIAGERLSEEMRADFVSKSKDLLEGMENQHKKRIESYKNIAQKNELPIDEVVIDITGETEIKDVGDMTDEELEAFVSGR